MAPLAADARMTSASTSASKPFRLSQSRSASAPALPAAFLRRSLRSALSAARCASDAMLRARTLNPEYP